MAGAAGSGAGVGAVAVGGGAGAVSVGAGIVVVGVVVVVAEVVAVVAVPLSELSLDGAAGTLLPGLGSGVLLLNAPAFALVVAAGLGPS
jgi:hypothetical protein